MAIWSIQATYANSTPGNSTDEPFRQLGTEWLPTANHYRTASGAPGHAYWQQKVDLKFTAECRIYDYDDIVLDGIDDLRANVIRFLQGRALMMTLIDGKQIWKEKFAA